VRISRMGLDLDLWLKTWLALQRVAVSFIVLCAHAGLERSVAFLYAGEFEGIKKIFAVTVQVTLISLHAWLLVEAVRIFLPEPYGIKLDHNGREAGDGVGQTTDF
jgi:hypothetical protein